MNDAGGFSPEDLERMFQLPERTLRRPVWWLPAGLQRVPREAAVHVGPLHVRWNGSLVIVSVALPRGRTLVVRLSRLRVRVWVDLLRGSWCLPSWDPWLEHVWSRQAPTEEWTGGL